MRPDRVIATVAVAVLVAVAGFSGSVAAVQPAANTVSHHEEVSQQEEAETVEAVNISTLTVGNLSTELELGSANITVETAEGTEQFSVDSANVTLENAAVTLADARLANGTFSLEWAAVTIVDGQVEIQTSQGDRSFDLSDTNESVEEVTIDVGEVPEEDLDLSRNLRNATIQEMTVEGFSGQVSFETIAVDVQIHLQDGVKNVSVNVQNGNVSVENATVTLENATVENGTLMVDSVNVSADSAEFAAESVDVLHESDLIQREDIHRSVEDVEFTRQNVEVDVEEWLEMLEQLLANETAEAAIES